MKFLKYLTAFLILIMPAFAQQGNMIVLSYSGAPTGTCAFYKYFAIDLTNGDFYDCFNGTWTKVNGGGAGAVSSVFTRTGAVVAVSGDYTVGQVTGAAPLASPTFTGTVGGITATMVGLGSVTNDAQTKAAIVPNTVPSAAQILAGNAGGTAYAPVSISGDSSMTSAGVMTNTKINNTAFSSLATGILKNTTGTGVPSIAAGSDLPSGIPIASVGSSGLSGTSPVTISAAGAIACATCVVASSPGVGIAHFAGSTQTVTSSAVDLSSADASGILAAARFPALTGDVTTSSGAVATTIANLAVTNAKIAAGTIDLTTKVTGVLPLANMSQLFVTNAQSGTYQVLAADFTGCKTIPVASGTFTITLVASGSQPATGQCIDIINYGSGVVTVARSGQNINGAAANLTIAAGSASAPIGLHVVSDGTNYFAQTWGGGAGAVSSVFTRTGAVVAASGDYSLDQVNALAASKTWANGVNTLTINNATTASGAVGVTLGETTASTSVGTPYETLITTLIGSTATPLKVANSLNGSQALPTVSILPTWNTSGVPSALLINPTNTTSGTGSLLIQAQLGGTNQFTADKAGNGIFANSVGTFTPPACTPGSGGGTCYGEGTALTNAASTTAIYADSTQHELMVATAGASTYGMFVRRQPGAIHQTAKTASISTATLCASSAGACNVAGMYHVHFDFIETGTACASVTAGSVNFGLTWTDTNGTAHAAVIIPVLNQTSATAVAIGNAFTFATALANAGASGDFNVSTNGSIIQYATTYIACTTGTGTYQLDATVTRLE